MPRKDPTHKVCRGCGVEKPVEHMRVDHRRTLQDGSLKTEYRNICLDCPRPNTPRCPVQVAGRKYKISQQQVRELWSSPCSICEAPPPSVIDHDHNTGQVRGALCSPCNKAIGMLRDDPALLLAAAHYLKEAMCHDTTDRQDV